MLYPFSQPDEIIYSSERGDFAKKNKDKEFKALSELDANLLAQRLGIKHHFKKSATLGEIYAMQKNKNTLIHDVEPDKGASNVIDDL